MGGQGEVCVVLCLLVGECEQCGADETDGDVDEGVGVDVDGVDAVVEEGGQAGGGEAQHEVQSHLVGREGGRPARGSGGCQVIQYNGE